MKLTKALVCAAALMGVSATATAQDGPWQIRVRAIDIVPDESSTVSIGGEARVDSAIMPELDITYFWTENFSTELILATTKHNVSARGTALGDLSLGDVWVLPPTLTFQYHANPGGKFRPYVGAGVNYTIFYDDNPGDVGSIKYEDGFGLALQAGVDIDINNDSGWFFNADVKRIWLNTDVEINGGGVTADVDLNPWVFGIGFGKRF